MPLDQQIELFKRSEKLLQEYANTELQYHTCGTLSLRKEIERLNRRIYRLESKNKSLQNQVEMWESKQG